MISIYDFQKAEQLALAFTELQKASLTRGTELITVYCKKNLEMLGKLKTQLNQAGNIKSKSTKQNVKEGLKTLVDFLQNNPSLNSVALFAYCKDLVVIKLPELFNHSFYRCGKSFETTPLKEHNLLKWGLIVIDTNQVTIGTLQNNNILVKHYYEPQIPGKMRAGGQSAQRFEQSRRKEIRYMIKEVSQKANQLFSNQKPPITKILLGGLIPTVEEFFRDNSLSVDFKNMLEEPTTVAYCGTKGLQLLVYANKDKYKESLNKYNIQQKGLHLIKEAKLKNNLYRLADLEEVCFTPRALYYLEGVEINRPYCRQCYKLVDFDHQHDICNIKDVIEDKDCYSFQKKGIFGGILQSLRPPLIDAKL